MGNQYQTGHDFAARAATQGAKVKSWDSKGNFYHAKHPDGRSVTFPSGRLAGGTRSFLLKVFSILGWFLVGGAIFIGYRIYETLVAQGVIH